MEGISSWPEDLKSYAENFNDSERQIISTLISLNQEHLFEDWSSGESDLEHKHAFLQQAIKLDNSYAGGLTQYITQSRHLLQAAQRGDNPMDGWTPQVPHGVSLEPFTEQYWEYERLGKEHVGRLGFILVAGGLGERLGYNGIKVSLPTETTTNLCYLGLYAQQILEIQRKYASPDVALPLAIMVSDDTHDSTIALLQDSDYFGLQATQVTIMKQEKVAALQSTDARMAKTSTYCLDCKPHGHGDVHCLMHSTGTAARWLAMGIRWCVFFQDTNGIGFVTLAAMLGVSSSLDLEVNSLSVPRHAKQAVGAITKLVHADGQREMTVNVEYNQLDPLLRASGSVEGDVNDASTGLSPYPGNINQLVFKLEPYVDTLERTQGTLCEFVNPKYSDSSRTAFKKPTRLECMMQDYPKALPAGSKVGFTMAPSWLCYSPCKNNIVDAAASISAGVPASSAYTAESDQYRVYAEILRLLGCQVASAPPLTIAGIEAVPGPRLVFHPSFALFPSDVRSRFPRPADVIISERSTVVISGDVEVKALRVDGALTLQALPHTKLIVDVNVPRSPTAEHPASKDEVEGAGVGVGVGVGGGPGGAVSDKAWEEVWIRNEGQVLEVLGEDEASEASEVTRMRGYVLRTIEEERACTRPLDHSPSSPSVSSTNQVFLFDGRAVHRLVDRSDSTSFAPTAVAQDDENCLVSCLQISLW